MSRKGKTWVYCARCRRNHYLTPSALALVVEALQNGEVHTTKGHLCIVSVLTAEVIGKRDGIVAWQKE